MRLNYDVIIIGGGPSGLSAAIEIGKFSNISTIIIDENNIVGGRLLMQPHKFFGSKDQYAGFRGFEIASILKKKLNMRNVKILNNTAVWAVNKMNNVFCLSNSGKSFSIGAKHIIFACGAKEKAIFFPGWTLPGVFYSGALQSLVNIYRVKVGENVLIVGSGNVGLIIAYQLLQAGFKIKAVVEKENSVGGYEVHKNKIQRLGVPIYTSSNLIKVEGKRYLKKAVVNIKGSRKIFNLDTVCIAVGMVPQIELLNEINCEFYFNHRKEFIPKYDSDMRINKNNFVCGDLSGVEEASIAMDEGKLVGLLVCKSMGVGGEISEDRIITLKKRIKNQKLFLKTSKINEKV